MAIYACSDLHGRLDLYQAIKKFLKPEDKVIFLGDAGDRGPQPWETIKAIAKDPQFTYIKGNHEDMLVKAMYFILQNSMFIENNPVIHCVINGGEDTLLGLETEENMVDWVRFLDKLPEKITYTNTNNQKIVLTHAGFHPTDLEHNYLWDREHINLIWPKKEEYRNTIVVHGHTPCVFLNKNWTPTDGAIWYEGGHKVDIDMGSYATGYTCLLDLDTLDEYILTVE